MSPSGIVQQWKRAETMEITDTNLPGVKLITPEVFRDERGFFLECFRESWFGDYSFVQDNHSKSIKGTLRGLHYQLNSAQGKLVRVIAGEIFDVAVDLRKSSPTFGRWVGRTLNAETMKMLWIPPGFAHGFTVLSESAEVLYKCTQYYDSADERAIVWNDPDIGIDWPLEGDPILSERDKQAVALKSADYFI